MAKDKQKYLLVINDCVEGKYDNLEETILFAEHCYYKNKYSKIEVDNVTDGQVEWMNGVITD